MARNTTNDRETASALWSLWQDHERRWKYGIQFRKCCITSGQSSATISQPTRPRKSHSNTQGTWNNDKFFIFPLTWYSGKNAALVTQPFAIISSVVLFHSLSFYNFRKEGQTTFIIRGLIEAGSKWKSQNRWNVQKSDRANCTLEIVSFQYPVFEKVMV